MIAQMRVNLIRPVHAKTPTSQKRQALLAARKMVQEKAIAIENDIRGMARNFGIKVGVVPNGIEFCMPKHTVWQFFNFQRPTEALVCRLSLSVRSAKRAT
jgi:hypothetical protein